MPNLIWKGAYGFVNSVGPLLFGYLSIIKLETQKIIINAKAWSPLFFLRQGPAKDGKMEPFVCKNGGGVAMGPKG